MLRTRFDEGVSAGQFGANEASYLPYLASSVGTFVSGRSYSHTGFATAEVMGGATVARTVPATVVDASTPSDPLYGQQWHLAKLGDMSAIWKDYTGAGVHVGVYDSGIQYEHPDLAANYDRSLELDIGGRHYDGDYRPASGPHGTSVAGIIAAARNGIGGVGIAYDASLTGVNIFDPYSGGGTRQGIYVNARDATLFFDAMRQSSRFDVVNHSWGGGAYYGTYNDRSLVGTFAHELTDAVSFACTTGRNGLGTISVVAAGNGGIDVEGSAQATDRHWITVGAYRELDNYASYYSERGAGLLISAPSSDFGTIGGTGVVTTDLVGRDGYNTEANPGGNLNYTDSFGGTSAATPMISGVATLMLDANDQLGWRDVQNILAQSAKLPVPFGTGQTFYTAFDTDVLLNESHFNLAGQNANWNGGALHYSTDYGYGAVDAFAAVRMAEVWSRFGDAATSANEAHVTSGIVPVDITVVGNGGYDETKNYDDFTGTPASVTFTVGDNIDLEQVDLRITYNVFVDDSFQGHQTLGTEAFKLIAPDGTVAFVDTLFAFGQHANGDQTFTFGFKNFHGTLSAGTWTLQFQTRYEDTTLTVKDVQFDGYGSAVTNDDVHTYTNEYLTMAALDGQGDRHLLTDTNGGVDWINAAAVTSNVTLSLTRGSTILFGTDTAFTVVSGTIENAVTGDGDDKLRGNRLANDLVGMRGDDILIGGHGDDTLEGGAGHDTFVFGVKLNTGDDTIADFSHDDTIAFRRDMGGSIAVGSDGVIHIDAKANGDTVSLGADHADSLRFLGQAGGLFYYGEGIAPVAGDKQTVIEGTFGNDVLEGTGKTDVFFFDTTGAFGTGADVVDRFTVKDLLVTTAAVEGADANGIVHLDPAGFLDLPGQGGTVTFTGTTPAAFELDGTVQHDGQTYFVYSLVSSAVGVADLTF